MYSIYNLIINFIVPLHVTDSYAQPFDSCGYVVYGINIIIIMNMQEICHVILSYHKSVDDLFLKICDDNGIRIITSKRSIIKDGITIKRGISESFSPMNIDQSLL